MPARGLGLNLGYAKNEANRSSRHRSLVSYAAKTIFSCSLFLPFMILSISLANSAQLLLSFLRAVFCFSSTRTFFLTLTEKEAGRWNLFSVLPTVKFVERHKKKKPAELLQPRLVNMPVMINLYGEFWPIRSIYCVVTANKTCSQAELSGTLMIRLQQSFPNKTFLSFFCKGML